jgi:hypothetical protein
LIFILRIEGERNMPVMKIILEAIGDIPLVGFGEYQKQIRVEREDSCSSAYGVQVRSCIGRNGQPPDVGGLGKPMSTT